MTPSRKTHTEKKFEKLADRSREIGRDCLGLAVRSLARKITHIYEARLEPQGVSASQFMMLNMIAGAKDDTLTALAAEAKLDPSTLTRNLQALEKLGLVEIAAVEQDMRKRAVWLTETGARKLSAAIPAWEEAQQEVSAALGANFRIELRKAGKTF